MSSKVEELKQRWNGTLLSILKRIYSDLRLEVPNLPSAELLEKAPNLLEEATRSSVQIEKGKHGFVVISAPSDGGKGTIGENLESLGFKRLPHFTTRVPRPGEVESKSYYFVSKDEFLQNETPEANSCPGQRLMANTGPPQSSYLANSCLPKGDSTSRARLVFTNK